jgi:hypothetical protein
VGEGAKKTDRRMTQTTTTKNFEDTLGSQVCDVVVVCGDTRIYPTTNKQKGKVSVKPESSF